MKLSKKEENEILEVYDTWWHSYLNGDLNNYDAYLDDEFRFVGCTDEEEFLNRSEAISFFRATADQLPGKAKFENIDKTMEALGGMVLITDLADVYILDNEQWVYNARFRCTSLMHKTSKGWRFLYQQFSTPNLNAEKGEAMGHDKVSNENQELRNVIKRKTAELEIKNRELEVEGALQRVRSQVTAMKESTQLLDIVVHMRNEFTNLGHQAGYFWHMSWLQDTFEKAMTSGDGSRIGMIMELPRDFHSHYEGMDEWEANEEPAMVLALETEEALDYLHKMVTLGDFKQVDPNAPTEEDIRHIGGITFVMARTTHGEIGYSLPGVVKKPPKEDLLILGRFAGVFDLAYRRFLDLQKAEEQAREVEIELALEKVRSRTMEMQHSDELLDVASVMFQQIKALGVPQWNCGFNIWEMGAEECTYYPGSPDGKITPFTCKIPLNEHAVFKRFEASKKRGEELLIYEKEGEEQKDHYEYMLSLPGVGDFLRTMMDADFELPTFQIDHVANFAYGNLLFITYEHFPEMHQVFKRFAKVFEQTYTRFLDLQKAEEQAREALIETSLERVRSRTMGMHNSGELKEVIQILFDQIHNLNINIYATGVGPNYKNSDDFNIWTADIGHTFPTKIRIPYFDHPLFHNFKKAKELGLKVYSNKLTFEEKNRFWDHCFKHLPVAQELKDVRYESPGYASSSVLLDKVQLFIFNLEGIPYSEDELAILMRFGKVFEQTYARFLDLQKAEAQARTSQINLAVERVRARAMAMYNSSELLEVVSLLRDEMLGLNIAGVAAATIYLEEGDGHIRMTDLTSIETTEGGFKGTLDIEFNLNETDPNLFLREVWGGKDEFFIVKQFKKDLVITLKWLREHDPDYALVVENFFKNIDWEYVAHPVVQLSNGKMTVDLLDQEPPLELESIMKKMASAFDLTYTRFLDLQKAEAQAREAQIEAALERVRSRTMGMIKSNELSDVASVLFKQITELNIAVWTTGFNVWSEDDTEYEDWVTTPKGGFIEPYKVDTTKYAVFIEVREAKQRGDDFFVQYVEGEDLKKMYAELCKYAPPQFEVMLQDGFEFPKHQYNHFVFENAVSLMFITYEPLPEAHDIFKRFGKVFQQTYTRFLDLQKAETQAREAQIEAALERVRARSMAMQETVELHDVLSVLFQQFDKLDIKPVTAFMSLFNLDKNEFTYRSTTKAGNRSQTEQVIDMGAMDHWGDIVKKWQSEKPDDIEEIHYDLDALPQLFEIFEESFSAAPEKERVTIQDFPNGLYGLHAYCKFGYLGLNLQQPATDEERDILIRFAREFTRVYQRFLDLQKAEAQAREAQIEASLEKVRSRSLAMQRSNDLSIVIKTISEELYDLNIRYSNVSFGIDSDDSDYVFWSSISGQSDPVKLTVPYIDHPITQAISKARKNKENFLIDFFPPEVHRVWLKHAIEHSVFKDLTKNEKEKLLKRPLTRSAALLPNIFLVVTNYRDKPYSDTDNDIIARFGQVFEQAYTRFLDLQKAEALAREANIEAALERVRSKTMAMHSSSDVKETVKTFFDQVLQLGIDKSIRCGIGILEGHEGMETWSVNADAEGKIEMRVGMLNMRIHPMLVGLKKAWEKGDAGYSYDYSEKDVLKYYTALNNEPEYPFNADLKKLPKKEYHQSFFFSSGIIFTFTENPLTEESSLVLHRFAEVFGQTYRRYLDLRKAEAQAREAQIEAALEKVRSRTMAMQASSELQEAANLLFLEVQDLGIKAWSAGYNIVSDDKLSSRCWMSSEGVLQDPFTLYFHEEASFKEMGEFLQSDQDFLVQELGGKELEQHYAYMKSFDEMKPTFDHIEESGLSLPSYQVNHLCKFSKGFLLFITYESVPKAHDIFKRFTKVFEQTFTRFQDLKKAENQSKEAQIELALERVRASTLAMHKSEQLPATAEVLFEQFDLMGILPDRISIAVYEESKKIFELWATDQNGTLVNHGHDFSIDEPTCMAKIFKAWRAGSDTCIVDLQGSELKDWVQYVKNKAKMEIDASEFEGRRVQHAAFFSHGYLLLSSLRPIADDMMKLLLRFAKVFEQSYTRFLDLKKAEKQAREAIKRASVDRVRAEIASMRTTTDLNRITPLVWNELTTLNVPFIRCGVFIMDEERQEVQTHLSTPDGKALASFQLSFDDTEPLHQLLPHWRKKELYIDHWDKQGFIDSTKILMEKGAIKSKETYLTKNQPDNLHLHFLPFLQGMLYVGSEVPLTEYALSLVQNLAEAFSSAYARYEDFNKLELANKKIEKTLVDLKQAQSQLVQSEKMASLGELTAGIAHEIQNPLNFVNNFSEVSGELLEEMYEEIKNGEVEEALEIGIDIEQNLQKIHHHGQRASEIVKGMLQHSRSSSGERELTDINALTDEYLRLAYHGLRAKDKTFNAKMDTDFDQGIEKVMVIPQDLGRVILNLITNAFYAVDQKKKQVNGEFEPKVLVTTKKLDKGLEIKVADNGNGIPKKVLEKIFQPFFTTKPTGQGTGLGLSLSYDIVTAHGGELKVDTKEGEGTTFVILLKT